MQHYTDAWRSVSEALHSLAGILDPSHIVFDHWRSYAEYQYGSKMIYQKYLNSKSKIVDVF